MTDILIIGGGKGGYALLNLLSQEKKIHIVGVSDINKTAPAFKLAEKLNIKTSTDYRDFFNENIDIILNVTNNPVLEDELRKTKPKSAEIMGGESSKMAFALLEAINKKHFTEKTRSELLRTLSTDEPLKNRLRKSLESILTLTEADVISIYLVEDESKPPCWSVHNCTKDECLAFNNFDVCCWSVCDLFKDEEAAYKCELCTLFYNVWFIPVVSSASAGEKPLFLNVQAKDFNLKHAMIKETPVAFKDSPKRPFSLKGLKNKRLLSLQVFYPLVSSKGTAGFIYLASKNNPNFFIEKVDIIKNIAIDISFALKNEQITVQLNEKLLQLDVARQVGLSLISEENIDELFTSIVKSSLKLTNSPAGSLAIFDAKDNHFEIVSHYGFSPEFTKTLKWKRRDRGLTDAILQNERPLVISDVSNYPAFDNPLFISEGIKALVAVPLMSEGETIGILYIDDFKVRHYTRSEVAALSLLSTQAAIAIQKTITLKETREMAIRDGLTGLFNYRYFHQRLDEEIQRARRYSRPLSLVLADIDYFKELNDLYGHLKGDEILKKISRILLKMVREFDFVARYGGEEFVIILPETTVEQASRVSERIKSFISNKQFVEITDPEKAQLTLSFGLASYPKFANDKFELIHNADIALYLAKKQGRDRICVYDNSLKDVDLPKNL